MLRKALLTLSCVAGALLLAALGYWNIAPRDEPSASAESDNAIDFYVENARTRQFQADGKLDYEMTSNRIEHFRESDLTQVGTPNLLLYRGEELPWRISSRNAEVAPDGKQVELIDDVRIARTDARGRPTVITSTRMTVFPDEEYAQTRQAVRIEAANGVTTANGMKAYLKDSRIHLLSSVRGQHEVR